MINDHLNIPKELTEQFYRRNGVLFVGAGVSIGAGLPGWGDLIGKLAAEIKDCPPNASYLDIAQYYYLEYGRNRLITRLKDELDTYMLTPTKVYSQLISLDVSPIFTTNFDNLIETALHEQKTKYDVVIDSVDVSFWTSNRVQLVKLHGDLSRPNSIVITSSDYEKYFTDHPTLTRLLTIALQTRTVLFIGYSASDIDFRFILNQVQSESGAYARSAYAVMFNVSNLVTKDIEYRGIKVINFNAEKPDGMSIVEHRTWQLKLWLNEFKKQIQSIREKETKSIAKCNYPLPSEPYKFLNYFVEEDSPIFHGRDYEIKLLKVLVLSHQVTVLYGESGTGKTSLIRAGLLPHLQDEAGTYIYFRPKSDSNKEFIEAVSKKFSFSCQGFDTFQKELDELIPDGKFLLLIIDQFEELFIRHGTENRKTFLKELVHLLLSYPSKVKLLLSLRSEYIHNLDYIQELGIRDPLRYRIRLQNLGFAAANIAISEPARNFNIHLEPPLLEKLVGDLEQGGIVPSQLQIVCYVMWKDWIDCGKSLDGLTLSRYYELGSTQGILAEYLDKVIKDIQQEKVGIELGISLDEEQVELAIKSILKSMVTSERTKHLISAKEISQGEIVYKLGMPQGQVESLIAYLQERRIIRYLPESQEYELVHEVLIDKIWGWVSDDEKKNLEIQDMLARAISDYCKFDHLLSREKLKLINSQCNALSLSLDELELIFRSSIYQNVEIPYWFERSKANGIEIDKIVLPGLSTPNFRARIAAIAVLARLGNQFLTQLTKMLEDNYPQVRFAAIAALECLQPDGEWRSSLVYECYVPAGKFLMGNDDQDSEKPVHELHLESFYVSKYPCTNEDYKLYLDANSQAFEIPPGKSSHPVVGVSWYDARDYARWANMRLLTEAEWEKAASHNPITFKKHQYPWGNEFSTEKCNTKEQGLDATTPVGSYSPIGDSSYQVADIAGNVWEWTSTLHKNYPYQSEDGREDPLAPGSRVLRGGCYHYQAQRARTTFRLPDFPYNRSGYGGFRVGFSISPQITIVGLLGNGIEKS